jgi:Sulfotransferase family
MDRESIGNAALFPSARMLNDEPVPGRLRLGEPVVVLTCARSGSTLLRFILDSHPELACPPETGVVDLCTRLGVVSMLLDGPAAGVRPGLDGLAAASIRSWVTATFGTYLIRAGKTRWCDKSLGSAESAHRFLDLFPEAKFICLYRHCMDVIDSALEACPFGLRGYGMDPYAAAHPGNSVGAAADYWVTHTRAIAEFEQAHPGACLRLRYEDLVADPEAQADRIFTFLGEMPVPGISRSCLAPGREEFGPGDHKIWGTTSITPDSVGRGSRIPVGLISPLVLTMVNGLLGQLDYPQIDQGAPGRPLLDGQGGPGTTSSIAPAGQEHPPAHGDDAAALDELEKLLASRLSDRLVHAELPGSGTEAAWSPFLITAIVPSADAGLPLARWWRVDPGTASLARGGAHAPDIEPGQWTVTGEAHAWRSVLTGELNIATAIRHGHLRYSGLSGSPPGTPNALRRDPYGVILRRLLAPPPADLPAVTIDPGQRTSEISHPAERTIHDASKA